MLLVINVVHPAGIYLLKLNNRDTRTRCETCLKLTTNTPERRQWRRSGVFIVNFEHVNADSKPKVSNTVELHIILKILKCLNVNSPNTQFARIHTGTLIKLKRLRIDLLLNFTMAMT